MGYCARLEAGQPAESIAEALPKHDRTKQHRKARPYQRVAECIDTVKASGARPVHQAGAGVPDPRQLRGPVRFGLPHGTRSILIMDQPGPSGIAHENEEATSYSAVTAGRRDTRRGQGANRRLSARNSRLQAGQTVLPDMDAVGSWSRNWASMPMSTASAPVLQNLGAGAEPNFPREVAEAALGPRDRRCHREGICPLGRMFERRRKMMERWAGYIAYRQSRGREARDEKA